MQVTDDAKVGTGKTTAQKHAHRVPYWEKVVTFVIRAGELCDIGGQ